MQSALRQITLQPLATTRRPAAKVMCPAQPDT